jgi:carbon-monoxide dehydrogenase medium subunit
MYPFAYRRPSTVAGAVALLAADEDAKVLAGGQTLLPILKHRLARPSALVDLRAIDGLRGIRVTDDAVIIGAMTEHAAVAGSREVRRAIPALARLASGIGDPPVRHMGTLGGSLAHCDPGADYPGAVLGLGAEIETDRRRIAADEYFRGMFETVLAADEIIVAVHFPIPRRAGYVKFANPASGYVTAGAFVADLGSRIRVAVNGAGPCVFRQDDFEAALSEDFATTALAGIQIDAGELLSDLHAGAEYRAHLAGVAVRRAVAQALATAS